MKPTLTKVTTDGVTFFTDVALFASTGIRVAFSARHGGISPRPYATLNLGNHVADDLGNVAINRQRLCSALALSDVARGRLNSAQQVHGVHVEHALDQVHEFPDTDALVTDRTDIPLLLCFADCVPIIVVDPATPAIGVIHSGWRGTLDRIACHAVKELQEAYHSEPGDLIAYIGPYIGLHNFTIGNDIGLQFAAIFDTINPRNIITTTEESVNLDLGTVIEETLVETGVRACNIHNMHIDTVRHVDDFFSYRAEDQVTGRFGALGCICS